MAKVNEAELSSSAAVNLVSSYETLHFKTFLQAHLVGRVEANCPRIRVFGFDQIEQGLRETESRFEKEPAIVLLQWSDIDPSLSWRSRADFVSPNEHSFEESCAFLIERLQRWCDVRPARASVIVLPQVSWYPAVDPVLPGAVGASLLRAQSAVWRLAAAAAEHNAFIVQPEGALDYRSLATAGFPMTVETACTASEYCAELLFPQPRRKLVIVDLDNTLWHGVLGEDGLSGIHCDDYGTGVPFLMFQKYLRKLRCEGILLAYCSKNDQSDVDGAFASDQVYLGKEDFVTGRAGWTSKSQNITDITTELGLGVDSVVFIDDSAAELAAVGSHVPGALCLQVPTQLVAWPDFLRTIQAVVWTSRVGAEDSLRTSPTNTVRREHMQREVAASNDGYSHLKSFSLRAVFNFGAGSDERSTELVNKTNQFNLSGVRVLPFELEASTVNGESFCYSVELHDRYGPYGTIGVVYGTICGDQITEVANLVLSCRSLGRGIEFLILEAVRERQNSRSIHLRFCNTARNEPARIFADELMERPGVILSELTEPVTIQIDLAALAAKVQQVHFETGVEICGN